MKSFVLTLFPEAFPGVLAHSIPGRAQQKGLWSLEAINIRDFATDRQKTVDGKCFGGGKGMLLLPHIVHAALTHAHEKCTSTPKIIYLSPQGAPLTQKKVKEISLHENLILLCGRYEGIDQRVIDYWRKHHCLEEVSIGDYILSGGELAAQVLLDATVRLLPGVLDVEATEKESFSLDLLEFPQYTGERTWNGLDVPSVLLSGHHMNIEVWKKEQAEEKTRTVRPDLWEKRKRK